MNEKEMLERKVWLEVYLRNVGNDGCEILAAEAVEAYRRMFPNNDSDTRD
jgi:hypothetical protein